ncbi:hypothetical protein [Pedobacter alpinus]|uniref:Transglutaminase-like domain-containing protein n=1 Tax=Pedobacter alpinus TaxID=1590643 RepID=A0ABW5TSZ7_9SPHI
MIAKGQNIAFQFYNKTFNIVADSSFNVDFKDKISEKSIHQFYNKVNDSNYQSLVNTLVQYKNENQLNDWFYYQLVRKTVQQISPKEDNYERYTLYKWFLLVKSGYDTRLAIGNDHQLLFYVWSDEDISDIPFFTSNKKQFVCLNFHDFKNANYLTDKVVPIGIYIKEAINSFSYKVTQIPDLNPADYKGKLLTFNYREKAYYFNVKLSSNLQTLFKNYPIVDFESYFNIPLSKETYSSIIPLLKKNIKGLTQKKGVDYLMRFTRNAFLYENDNDIYGKEKRLSPEQTLFSDYSDCDDRAALFFYLVKEIYNLPMITLLYPTHITIAVKFDKPIGTPISYKGENYYVCEPTPQKKDLKIGEISPSLRKETFQIVYQYQPNKN